MLEEAQILSMLGMASYHDAEEMPYRSLGRSLERVQQAGRGKKQCQGINHPSTATTAAALSVTSEAMREHFCETLIYHISALANEDVKAK